MIPPIPGIVYSRDPHIASASNDHRYYIKGPQPEVVVAEYVAYELAALMKLATPPHALCRLGRDREVYFASQEVRTRSGLDELLKRGIARHPEFMCELAVFDIWITNHDRNRGNIVAEPVGGREGAEIELRAIDFEKSDLLSGTSGITVTAYAAGRYLPKLDLVPFCRNASHRAPMLRKIHNVTSAQIEGIFTQLATAIGPVAWATSATHFLASRAANIAELVTLEFNA